MTNTIGGMGAVPVAEGERNLMQFGMQLRDYFASHAPSEPQPWFNPVMPKPRPAPRWIGASGREYATWAAAELAEGDDGFSDVNSAIINAWDAERIKQRFAQWPWAWADAVLAAKGKL